MSYFDLEFELKKKFGFSSFKGERFEIGRTENSRKAKIVESKLILPDEQEILFKYTLRESNKTWQIVNILAQGVSDLAIKRSEYRDFTKENTLANLNKRISEKILMLQNSFLKD